MARKKKKLKKLTKRHQATLRRHRAHHTKKKERKVREKKDFAGIWNDLSYWDGLIFSLYLGVMYWCKQWIDDYWWRKKD